MLFTRKRKSEWRTLRVLDSAPWWRWMKRELPRPSFEGTGRVRLAKNTEAATRIAASTAPIPTGV
jgi:hypothetical protein